LQRSRALLAGVRQVLNIERTTVAAVNGWKISVQRALGNSGIGFASIGDGLSDI
jgi:hypothetical protein